VNRPYGIRPVGLLCEVKGQSWSKVWWDMAIRVASASGAIRPISGDGICLIFVLPMKIGCARRGRGRSIDLIIGVALPAGRSKAPPSIFSPFRHPHLSVQTNTGADRRNQVLATVAKVRNWSRQLSSGRATFADIAAGEGVSVARVSQLMVLDRLRGDEVDAFLTRSTRPSLRGLISFARGMGVQPTNY